MDGSTTAGWLTTTQMIEVDRVMIEDLGISLVRMMENAGRSLARFALDRYRPARVAVCVGSGGNGGGGMVAARHLHNQGVEVIVLATRSRSELRGVPAEQAAILHAMGMVVDATTQTVPDVDVVLDAVIGYSLGGAPTGRAATLIDAIGDQGAPVISLDVPSGTDASRGTAPGAAVTADATLTLAAPKVGLAAPHVGALFVADISVPPAVIRAVGGVPPDFSRSPIVPVG